MPNKRKQFPMSIQRRDGCTVLRYSDSIEPRFDIEEDRLSFEAWSDFHSRLLEAANRQDYVGAAELLRNAMDEGLDEYALIEYIPDDTTRELVILEWEKIQRPATPAEVNAIRMRWPIIDGGKGSGDDATQ